MKYKKGEAYQSKGRTIKTFTIDEYTNEDTLAHGCKIEVYGDDILRNKIIQKLNNETNSPLEDFIQMLKKKAPEYLETLESCSTVELDLAHAELSEFTSWLISQTGEYKRIQAERKEYLSKADEKDQEMKKYTEERWF